MSEIEEMLLEAEMAVKLDELYARSNETQLGKGKQGGGGSIICRGWGVYPMEGGGSGVAGVIGRGSGVTGVTGITV
jgi:hypothetical protein